MSSTVLEEIESYIAAEEPSVLDEINEYLLHYGIKRRSGRYPYGSGKDPYQHSRDFLSRVEELKAQGWKETPENIMEEFGLTTKEYRAEKGVANDRRRMDKVDKALSLKADGLNTSEIARRMGTRESTVRSWLNAESDRKMRLATNTANFIREQIDTKGPIMLGKGVEKELGISPEKLDQAICILKQEGYETRGGRVDQGTDKSKKTTIQVIGPPDMPKNAAYDYENIHTLHEYASRDGGETFSKFQYPASMDSKRLQICYKEDGGIEKDGIVELRRNVPDLSLGNSSYAQVRILVDGTHYIKGMAVYSDDLPDGVDVRFNTNKDKSYSKMEVLKSVDKNLKKDPENPFGSAIGPKGQSEYIGADGKKHLSLINKRADQGDWSEWKDALPAQFLSKQSLKLAKQQLDIAMADKDAEYKELQSLTQPTVKKYLLKKFAQTADSAAVHLQAAALPGQKYHVIIPFPSLKDTEIYAPNYENGTKLALVRYPHGGIFEIPILTVNNKHAVAKDLLGNASDAVGINSKIAEQLSGADFDGDTVMCLPTHNGKIKISSQAPLDGLKNFDSKQYRFDDKQVDADGKERYYRNGIEFKIMSNTQRQMGEISNLITDMNLLGADEDDQAAAVRHSMVVIDAEKHKLDYKQSEIDNNIAALKRKYQRTVREDGTIKYGGASTLISRAKGEESVTRRQGSPMTNTKFKKNGDPNSNYDPSKPEGALLWKDAKDAHYEKTVIDKRTGDVKTVVKTSTQRSTHMMETEDARTLISAADTPMEHLYADYANHMKQLARDARLEYESTGKIAYNANSKAIYQKEVDSLMDKLNRAELNAPRERMARVKAAAAVQAKQKAAKEAGVELTKDDIKKTSDRALAKARIEVGSVSRKERNIDISDREWEAIMAGAISENHLNRILDNTDIDKLRERATPRATSELSDAKIAKLKAMSASYTNAELAEKFGISPSTVSKYLKSK